MGEREELLARLESWALSFNDLRDHDPDLTAIHDQHRDDLNEAVKALRAHAQGANPCGCGPMCEDKGVGICRYHDVSPTRKQLRHLVDAVYQHATESTTVPSTDTADRLITKMIIPSHDSRAPEVPDLLAEIRAHLIDSGLWTTHPLVEKIDAALRAPEAADAGAVAALNQHLEAAYKALGVPLTSSKPLSQHITERLASPTDAGMRERAASADAVRERRSLEAMSFWCTEARYKIRGRGGFDDMSDREIGIALVEAELDRRAAALTAPIAGCTIPSTERGTP